jgi:hypothetical protein
VAFKNIIRAISRNRKKKEIFLHIGSPKTGTTSIQRTFFHQRKMLLQEGVLYPSIAPKHFFLYAALLKEPHKFKAISCNTPEQAQKYLEEKKGVLESELQNIRVDKIIISSEELSILGQSEVEQLADYLKGLVEKVTVVCYVRDPVSYISSQTQQYIKNGIIRYSQDIGNEPFFNAKKVLTRFINAFGKENVKVRDFNRMALYKGDLLDDFANLIGLAPAICEKLKSNYENSNETISEEGLIIMDRLNLMLPPRGDLKRLANPAESVFPRGMRGGRRFEPPKDIWKKFQGAITSDLEFLSDEFGVQLRQTTKTTDATKLWGNRAIDGIAENLLFLAGKNESLLAEKLMLEGDIFYLKSKPEQAIRKYYHSIKIRPDFVLAYTHLIKLLAEQGRKDEVQKLKVIMQEL